MQYRSLKNTYSYEYMYIKSMKYSSNAAFLLNSTELLYCYLIPREQLTFQNETFPRHKKFFWLHNITPKQPTAHTSREQQPERNIAGV